MRLRFELLGGFSARLDAGQPCSLPTRKTQALLAYLALPPGRFHTREKLTALLWGDTAEAQARQSFRQALARIRRAISAGGPEILLAEGDTVALNPALVSVDAADLEAALTDGSPGALTQAAALYKGDLLDGLAVDETPFEEWRVVERERLRELALEGLAKLLREQLRAEPPEPAIQTALRILGMDPLQEAVHRAVMRLLLKQGRRAAALQQYQVCVNALQHELAVEPEEETRELYREILRAGSHTPRRPGAVATPPPAVLFAGGARAAETPIVGREPELERLQGSLRRMLDAGGNVVLISGGAGIGKSRLIQEFATYAANSGMSVAVGRCYESEQALPLHPWIDALRGDRVTLDPALRDRLGAATGAELGRVFPELSSTDARPAMPGVQQALLFDALAELVRTQVATQPMVLVLEDLHWTDPTSARLLAYLGRRIHDLPVLIVGSVRPEDLVDVPVLAQALSELRTEGKLDEIPLRPLSEDETRRLVAALRAGVGTGRDWDHIVDDVWEVSEGNPFVVVESIRAVRDQGITAWVRGSGLAQRVQDFVASRLGRLADRPRHIVATAAAIGRDFSFSLLARAAHVEEGEAAEAVEELVRRRILDAVGDRLGFCHDWIRRLAYEGLLPPKRAVLHASIGEALEQVHRERLDDVADQLGHHFSRAGDASKAVTYLVRFADLAARRYALDAAHRAFGQALVAMEQLSPSERERRRLDVVLRQAFLLSILGRQHEILELLRTHAGSLDRVDDPALISEYYFRLGLTQFFLGDYARSQDAAQKAVLEGERTGNDEAVGKALHVLSLSARDAGNVEDGIAAAKRGIALLDRPSTARDSEARMWLGLIYHDLSVNCLSAGVIDPAVEAADRAEEISHTVQVPRLRTLAGYAKAWARVMRGDFDAAIEMAQQHLAESRDPLVAGLLRGTLGYAHLDRGDARPALEFLSQAVEHLKTSPLRHGEIRYMALLGEAQLLSGDALSARETAARALALSEAAGMPFATGLAQRALGRIAVAAGKIGDAGERFDQALATFARGSAAYEAARTHMDLAALRAGQGDKHTAQEHLARATATFEAADAPKRVAQTRELARTLGLEEPSALT
jgi:DNA-binding SARP family transcriptional activator/predicted ATPase